MKFIPKPTTISAVQNLLGNVEPTWLFASQYRVSGNIGGPIVIQAPCGQLTAQGGDWIIQGPADELTVMPDRIFAANYQPSP